MKQPGHSKRTIKRAIRVKLRQIKKSVSKHGAILERIRAERMAEEQPIARLSGIHPDLKAKGLAPQTFRLLAEGDSWFDYPRRDLVDYLRARHGHAVGRLAVAGSTLNEIAYGRFSPYYYGVRNSEEVSRIEELVHRIQADRPQGLLLSAGGNDIAGREFFSFLNNSRSGLSPINEEVLRGVVDSTLYTAYVELIDTALAAAEADELDLKIFTHGYDYPWPDGRGVTFLNLAGPWFDESFTDKNYPYDGRNAAQLRARYEITKVFIDQFDGLLRRLSAEYSGLVFRTRLIGTLTTHKQWANELHPRQDGFAALSDRINVTLHENLS